MSPTANCAHWIRILEPTHKSRFGASPASGDESPDSRYRDCDRLGDFIVPRKSLICTAVEVRKFLSRALHVLRFLKRQLLARFMTRKGIGGFSLLGLTPLILNQSTQLFKPTRNYQY
ncbi:uncharacterized protein RSE6_09953 [Rhynchosporium secalis]|uniref:Uncharacterized protein n=1 Tax=Rhynchosporium secalis TaxID=38038 RepID=A0A1E1MJ83_RHYSE|nr:uncharacterized protein RSE6_09953 [Rhynchosporium secalis]